jgi:opacity protein-like surface antigen
MSKNMWRLLLTFIMISLLTGSLSAQEKKGYISIFGGINNVREYGSVDDYILGENDFPVTPTHSPRDFGMLLGYSFFKGLGLEVDFRYHLSSSLTLEDPSDGDIVSIDSSKHYTLTANLIYQFLSGPFKPYVLLGAGIDSLTGVEDQELTTEFEFPFTIYAPEEKTATVINGGAGCMYFFNRIIGVRLDIRYVHIFDTKDMPSLNSVNGTVGLVLRF